jgi:hypothetical protein
MKIAKMAIVYVIGLVEDEKTFFFNEIQALELIGRALEYSYMHVY